MDANLEPIHGNTRRVGTITLGVSLVVVGIGMLVCFFYPDADFVLLAKFSPLILVGIGLEVLITAIRNKDSQLRIDFLSGFICFLLIFFSMGLAVFVSAAQYYFNHSSNLYF